MEAATIAQTKLPPLRTILDALPNPILVVDENNVICFANSAAEDFFHSSSTMLGRHKLEDAMPFSSPVLEVVEQVRQSAGVMNGTVSRRCRNPAHGRRAHRRSANRIGPIIAPRLCRADLSSPLHGSEI